MKNSLKCKIYRQNLKKDKIKAQMTEPYTSRRQLLEQVRRTEKIMPKNNEKKVAIASEIIRRCDSERIINNPQKAQKPSKFVDIALEKFYLNDRISTCLPGKNDAIAIKKSDGSKEKMQKRVLKESKQETFKIFQNDHPELKISFSKFCASTPLNVQSFRKMPKYSCTCKYHANFSLMSDSIKPSMVNAVCSSKYEFLSLFACSLQNYDCMSGTCDYCSEIKGNLQSFFNFHPSETVKACQWTNDDRFVNKQMSWPYQRWLDHFSDQLEKFKLHYYTCEIQAEAFNSAVHNIPANEIVVILDFSENFVTKSQYEIQNAFFTRKMITLLTGVAYVAERQPLSFCIVSNALRHDKFLVYLCKKKIIEWIDDLVPNISHISWFSDGAPSHFKNNFSISNLLLLKKEHGIDMSWNFFGSGHGKGPADGIGGNVKNMMETRIYSQNLSNIDSANEFYDAAKLLKTSISFMYLDDSDVELIKPHLNNHFKRISPVKNLRQFHLFEVVGDCMLRCFSSSNRTNEHLCKILK